MRVAIAENGDLKFIGDAEQAGNVVAVFMSDQNGCEVFRRAANGSKALADLTRGKTGINKHASFRGLNVSAIAGRTTSQYGKFYRHTVKLEPSQRVGKCFWWWRNLIFIPTGTILWPGTIHNRLPKMPDRETKP